MHTEIEIRLILLITALTMIFLIFFNTSAHAQQVCRVINNGTLAVCSSAQDDQNSNAYYNNYNQNQQNQVVVPTNNNSIYRYTQPRGRE